MCGQIEQSERAAAPMLSRKGRKDRPFAPLASCLLGKRARNCRLCPWRTTTTILLLYSRNAPRSCAWDLAANSNYMRLTLACDGIIITRLLPHSALIKYICDWRALEPPVWAFGSRRPFANAKTVRTPQLTQWCWRQLWLHSHRTTLN